MKNLQTFQSFLTEGSHSPSTPSLDSRTGLVYYFDIPFTKEDIVEILDGMKKLKGGKYTTNKQFDVEPMIRIKDRMSGEKHNFSVKDIEILAMFYAHNIDAIASRKDFK